MKYELKIAENTLAQNARLLKRLEKSKNRSKKARSHDHHARVHFNRSQARAHHLALGFLRGRTMDEMELPLRPLDRGHITSKNMTRHAPDWARVEELVLQHGLAYFENVQALQQSFAEFKGSWTIGNV